jgi:N-formylglutamate deformylase
VRPGVPVPVVACLPHDGDVYPAELAADLQVSPGFLYSDLLTTELYAFLPELGVTTITTRFSRFVADVNRDPSGPLFGPIQISVVAERLRNGRQLYRRPLTDAQLRQRVRLAHEPFHHAVDHAIAGLLGRFPRVLLLDLHSFGARLPGDILLGDRGGWTARASVTGRLASAFAGQGFDVRINEGYTGGFTVRRFAGHDSVDAVQIELNQRVYLDFTKRVFPPRPVPGSFAATCARLRGALECLRAWS